MADELVSVENWGAFLFPPPPGTVDGAEPFPSTLLRTIFIDNGREREGPNVRSNVLKLLRFAKGEIDMATAAPRYNFSQDTRQRLVDAARVASGGSGNNKDAAAAQHTPTAAPRPKPGAITPNVLDRRPTSVLSVVSEASVASVRKTPTPPPLQGSKAPAPVPGRRRAPAPISANEVHAVAPGSLHTQFVSTIRGMYGSIVPQAGQYLQDELSTVGGLKKQARRVAADDDDDEEWGCEAPGGPAGLSRILRRDATAEVELGEDVTCPHCSLAKADPPVYQVQLHDDSRKRLAKASCALAATATTTAAKRQPDGFVRRYGNLVLGILTPAHALDSLWHLIFLLQPPRELQVLSYPAAKRPQVPQLSTDEWAIVASRHFSQHIGVPPWQEYFIAQRRQLTEWVRGVVKECDTIITRIRDGQHDSERIVSRIEALERVLDVRNPEDEKMRLKTQLQATQQEVVLKKWELDDTRKRAERARRQIIKNHALSSVAQEDVRRLVARVVDMMALSRYLNLPIHTDLEGKARSRTLSILERLPSTTGRVSKKVAGKMKEGELFQCPDCLMLTSHSPFCAITGESHGALSRYAVGKASIGWGLKSIPSLSSFTGVSTGATPLLPPAAAEALDSSDVSDESSESDSFGESPLLTSPTAARNSGTAAPSGGKAGAVLHHTASASAIAGRILRESEERDAKLAQLRKTFTKTKEKSVRAENVPPINAGSIGGTHMSTDKGSSSLPLPPAPTPATGTATATAPPAKKAAGPMVAASSAVLAGPVVTASSMVAAGPVVAASGGARSSSDAKVAIAFSSVTNDIAIDVAGDVAGGVAGDVASGGGKKSAVKVKRTRAGNTKQSSGGGKSGGGGKAKSGATKARKKKGEKVGISLGVSEIAASASSSSSELLSRNDKDQPRSSNHRRSSPAPYTGPQRPSLPFAVDTPPDADVLAGRTGSKLSSGSSTLSSTGSDGSDVAKKKHRRSGQKRVRRHTGTSGSLSRTPSVRGRKTSTGRRNQQDQQFTLAGSDASSVSSHGRNSSSSSSNNYSSSFVGSPTSPSSPLPTAQPGTERVFSGGQRTPARRQGSPGGGGKRRKHQHLEPPPLIAMEVMAAHVCAFLGAAADKDLRAMREATLQLQQNPAFAKLNTNATIRSLVDLEEQFYAWYSVAGRLPPTNIDSSIPTILKSCKVLTFKAVEQKNLHLKKELRSLEYAYEKRPKGRGGGAVLDDHSFAALTLKITDLERSNASLRIKIRQVNEQRRVATVRTREADNSNWDFSDM